MKIRKPTTAGVVLAGVAVVLSLALVPAALAGKGSKPTGGSGGSSTLTGPVMVNDVDGNGAVSHGDWINFNVSTTATGTPTVGLRCYQNGNFVLDGYVGYYPSWMFTPYFILDSSYWQSGVAADCTARLFYNNRRGQEVVLSTLTFTVPA
jgi:hypothetical protein